EREKTTVLFITHDLSLAGHLCDRIMVLYLGKVVELSTARRIMESPLHPYTRILMSYSPSIFKKREKINVKRLHVEAATGPGCVFAPRCPYSFEKCTQQMPPLIEIEPNHSVACWLYPRT
ncbi:MAG: Oligopeptide/dipeptide ABC transporter, ATPase subunit, partial [Thermotoga sp. 50_1627]